ncbi:MAG: ribbon-helix-helix domain-containing protein [archaeon]
MEHVSIQLDSGIARQIEKTMKEFHYSTKTEFIRESIRDKLKALNEEKDREKTLNALIKYKGVFKGKGKAKTDEEWVKWRKEFGEKLAKEIEEKYGLKN